jgi:Plasmid pRiA4b ORF-3-like protein
VTSEFEAAAAACRACFAPSPFAAVLYFGSDADISDHRQLLGARCRRPDRCPSKARHEFARAGQSGVSYPRYVGGERNGPPEDCGGIPGFYEMLAALADPKHPDHADAKQWFDDYDPAPSTSCRSNTP